MKTMNCPYCGLECEADWCDVGVGLVQCGPFHCSCGASEIGPHDEERPLSAEEVNTGWYAPGSPPGSSANMLNGQIVSAKDMKDAYTSAWEGNPDYHVPGAVDRWYAQHRKPETMSKISAALKYRLTVTDVALLLSGFTGKPYPKIHSGQKASVRRLTRAGLALQSGDEWELTEKGQAAALACWTHVNEAVLQKDS